MEKLLVVGADTIAGANISLALADRMDVIGFTFDQAIELDGIPCEYCHKENQRELSATLDAASPDWIIYCGPLSASSWDLSSHDSVWEHEPGVVAILAESAKRHHAQLSVVATDAVFTGPRMFHEEDSATTTHHPAATAALRLEQTLAETRALVVRTHVYGWAPAGVEPGIVEKIWQGLSSGSSVATDGQRYATPILATDLAELLYRAYQIKLQGLYHITGAERTSTFRLANEMATIFGLQSLSNRTALALPQSDALHFGESSLNCRRARRALESPMPMLREGLGRFAQQLADGWQKRSHKRSLSQFASGCAA